MGHEVMADQIEKQAALAKGTARTLQQLNAKASALDILSCVHWCHTAAQERPLYASNQAAAAITGKQGRDARMAVVKSHWMASALHLHPLRWHLLSLIYRMTGDR